MNYLFYLQIEVNSDKGIAVLHVPVREDFDKLLQVSEVEHN